MMRRRETLVLAVWCVIWAVQPVPAAAEMIVDTAWVRTFDGEGWSDFAKAIAVDGSGNVCVTGVISDSTGSLDYATVKYHPNGDVAWVRTYSGPGGGWDVVSGIAVDSWSNVYVTGSTWDSTTRDDFTTIKYHPNGDTGWVRKYDGPAGLGDYAHAITVDDSGYVYTTGCSYDTATYSGSNSDYVTTKYHPEGYRLGEKIRWTRVLQGYRPGHRGGRPWQCLRDRSKQEPGSV